MLPYIYSKNTDYLYFDDKNNRYILGKVGKASGAPLICFGINPSTATPENGDNTITAITNMSNHFGYNGWVMLNIYPQRSTKQHNLDKTCDVKIHQKNLEVIRSVFEALLTRYGQLDVLCAWGGGIMNRSYLPKCLQDISAISKDKINYKCLCTLKNGHPHHPLYISYKK